MPPAPRPLSCAGAAATPAVLKMPAGARQTRSCVAIGVSTGGPPAVQKVLAALPADFPAFILIAQHMPATFTGPFAQRLNSASQISVKEAEDGERPKPGWAYVCPGGKHLSLTGRGTMPYISVSLEPTSAIYKPSATVLMESAGRVMGPHAVGVIMTGMGSDGCEGIESLRKQGGFVIAQNEASCVVYGMPKAVVDANFADEIVELDKLAETILEAVHR
jgi:two-component system chemotaxis response regulator CheB